MPLFGSRSSSSSSPSSAADGADGGAAAAAARGRGWGRQARLERSREEFLQKNGTTPDSFNDPFVKRERIVQPKKPAPVVAAPAPAPALVAAPAPTPAPATTAPSTASTDELSSSTKHKKHKHKKSSSRRHREREREEEHDDDDLSDGHEREHDHEHGDDDHDDNAHDAADHADAHSESEDQDEHSDENEEADGKHKSSSRRKSKSKSSSSKSSSSSSSSSSGKPRSSLFVSPTAYSVAQVPLPPSTPVSSNSPPGGHHRGGSMSILPAGELELVHSCPVELYEMLGQRSKGHGAKGLALLKVVDPLSFAMLVYTAEREEFQFAIGGDAELMLLSDRFATFTDPSTRRQWSVKFASTEHAHDFARAFCLCKDDLSAHEFANGGPRRSIMQDLAVGLGDGPCVHGGDEVKVRYSVYLTSDTHPIGLGECVVSRESKKFIVGDGHMSLAIEQSVLGMHKKGVRFVTIPPMMVDSASEFGPLIPPNCSMLLEITVTSLVSHAPVSSSSVASGSPSAAAATRDETSASATATATATSSASALTPLTESQQHALIAERMRHLSLMQASLGGTVAPVMSGFVPTIKTAHLHHVDEGHETSTGDSLVKTPVSSASSSVSSLATSSSFSHHALTHTTPPRQHQQHHRAATAGAGAESGASYDAELEECLQSMGMLEFLPNFKREGVRFADLPHIDADELKVLVPQMGPRRRLMARIQDLREVQQQSQDSSANITPSVSFSNRTGGGGGGLSASSSFSSHAASSAPTSTSTATATPSAALSVSTVRARHAESSGSISPAAASWSPLLVKAASRSTSASSSSSSLAEESRREYERGKQEAVQLARERIDQIKETAQQRFSEVQRELDEQRQKNEHDVTKAREVIAKLREDARAVVAERDQWQQQAEQLRHEKDELLDKSRTYVHQLKQSHQQAIDFAVQSAIESTQQSQSQALHDAVHAARTQATLQTLDVVYQTIVEQVQVKSYYDGQQVIELMKRLLKSVGQKQQQQ